MKAPIKRYAVNVRYPFLVDSSSSISHISSAGSGRRISRRITPCCAGSEGARLTYRYTSLVIRAIPANRFGWRLLCPCSTARYLTAACGTFFRHIINHGISHESGDEIGFLLPHCWKCNLLQGFPLHHEESQMIFRTRRTHQSYIGGLLYSSKTIPHYFQLS
jgi:hypothetical protein